MTFYLDVGAKRIQAYLARTPRLRGRRGASALLEHDRLVDWTRDAWSPHAEINDECKQTDGVLSLRFTDPGIGERTVADVAAETATLLQRLAPGAEWDVLVRNADDYRQARRAGATAQRAGQDLLQLPDGPLWYQPLPTAPSEIPVVRFCDTCGLDSAVCTGPVEPAEPGKKQEAKALCADCSRRFLEGGYRTDNRNWTVDERRRQWQKEIAPGGLGAERDLRTDVAALRNVPVETVSVAENFTDLAVLGSGDANHLCTVFIDGNRFGDLFHALENTDIRLRELSSDLNQAVRGALAAATAAVTNQQDACLPVIPHLLGGDDLLASVTAERAWDFVVAFLDDYHQRTAALATSYQQRTNTGITAPTASAGLVFAHDTYPFADCLDLAETALRRAKARHKALTPAVCWIDVTEDGPQLPSSRSAPSLSTLSEHRDDLDRLCTIPAAGRAELAETARDGDELAVAGLAHRLGRTNHIRPFQPPRPTMPLLDALILGRWWQCRRPA